MDIYSHILLSPLKNNFWTIFALPSSLRPYPPSGRGRPTVPDIIEASDSDTKRMHSRISMPAGSAHRALEPFHKDSVTPGMGIRPENAGTPVNLSEKEGATDSGQEHKVLFLTKFIIYSRIIPIKQNSCQNNTYICMQRQNKLSFHCI